MYPHQNTRKRPRGFTLLEMLLVLSILVVVSSLTAPALRGPLESYRLRRSADLVRAQWTKARNAAMRTGSVQVFQFAVGGNHFQIQPWSTGADEVESSQEVLVTGAVSAGGSGSMQMLPDNVIFVSGDSQADSRSAALNTDQDANQSGTDGAWGNPIVFYPDGTTSTAELILANDSEQHLRLRLRGLTGIATVSDLLSAEEVMQ